MGYFAAVEPDAMVFAAVDNHAAAMGEYAPVHKGAADRTFDVFDFFIGLMAILIDIVQILPICFGNVRGSAFKQDVYFSGIKKQSKTIFTALDQNGAVDIDGLQGFLAMRAQSVRPSLDSGI
ncbi:hypothetical protein [Methylobacter sp. Wu1]|uniref:hypothetical protein n=1 Tax=Methylobacter sp. Wu1 TaxID=3119359 RepID=UPI0032AEF441